MALYRLSQDGSVVRAADGTSIPSDPRNRDWQDYQKWVAAGNVADPYVPPAPPTPDQIYDQTIQGQQVMKALVLALNDGSFVPGSKLTAAQIKSIIKAKM